MGERTSHPPGTFCWTELATSDAASAKGFYGSLFGWEGEDLPAGEGGTYTLLRLGGKDVAGLYQTDQSEPVWLPFEAVAEADTSAVRAAELGGTVPMPPFDVMTAGRMALVTDPTGATFALWQAKDHIGAGLVNDPGALCLNQLNTSDPEAAEDFYGELFGWQVTAGGTEEQPYLGIYNPTVEGPVLNGGMMRLPPDAGAASHWLSYFTTSDLDAAAVRISSSGGRVLVPPMPIPGGGRIAVATDPQGAVFALFEGRVDP